MENSTNWRARPVSLDHLKGFNSSAGGGYGVALNEIVTFPSEEDVRNNPQYYLKQRPIFAGSNRSATYVLITRTKDGISKLGWISLGSLFRQASKENKEKYYTTDFMRIIANKEDDYERLCTLFGVSIIGDDVEYSYGLIGKGSESTWGPIKFINIDEYIDFKAESIKDYMNYWLQIFNRIPEFFFCENIQYQDGDLCYDGISISEMKISEYNGERVLALVYNRSVKGQAKGNIVYDNEVFDPNMKVILVDGVLGTVSRVKEVYTLMHRYYFASKCTKCTI